MHLVEELASGGELFDRIIELGLFCEKDAVRLIHQVFDGIQYLHTHGMIHRDLKPENILMVGREPGTEEYMMLKICDFGLSAQRSEAKSPKEWEKTLQEFCGTQVSPATPCLAPLQPLSCTVLVPTTRSTLSSNTMHCRPSTWGTAASSSCTSLASRFPTHILACSYY